MLGRTCVTLFATDPVLRPPTRGNPRLGASATCRSRNKLLGAQLRHHALGERRERRGAPISIAAPASCTAAASDGASHRSVSSRQMLCESGFTQNTCTMGHTGARSLPRRSPRRRWRTLYSRSRSMPDPERTPLGLKQYAALTIIVTLVVRYAPCRTSSAGGKLRCCSASSASTTPTARAGSSRPSLNRRSASSTSTSATSR